MIIISYISWKILENKRERVSYVKWSGKICEEIPSNKAYECYAISLIIREMQIDTQWGITSHWSEWPSSTSLQIRSAEEGVENKEPSNNIGGNVNWCPHYGEQYGGFSEN